MDLSISIVSWNTRDLLDQCLRSVCETTDGIEYEVIVVDNASADGSAEMVRERYPQAGLAANRENVGFVRANNQAFDVANGRHFLLLNPDTICLGDALATLVRFLDSRPDAGAVGPLVLNEDRTLQHSWARFPTLWGEVIGRLDRRLESGEPGPETADETRALGAFEAQWIGGCCLMVRREAAEQIGLLDESLFMYSEETDWCLRLRRAGWGVWVEPRAEIVHFGAQSTKQIPAETARILRKSKAAFFAKHYGRPYGIALGAALGLKAAAKGMLGRDST